MKTNDMALYRAFPLPAGEVETFFITNISDNLPFEEEEKRQRRCRMA